MHTRVRSFVELLARTVRFSDPILEIGSFQVPSQEAISNLRHLFPGRRFVGTDLRLGKGVDVVVDIHRAGLGDEVAGAIVCCETLEHVEFPRKAVSELHRVLMPDGIMIVSVPMNLLIHNHPSDYWRYTPEGLRSLLAPFRHVLISSSGDSDFPESVVGIAFKGNVDDATLAQYQRGLDSWAKEWSGVLRHGFRGFLKLFVPPIVLGMWRKLNTGMFWTRGN